MTSPDGPSHIPQAGERFLGTVIKTVAFGAFVALPAGGQGLLHVSQISKLYGGRPIKSIDEVIRVGDQLEVEVLEVDDRGKVALTPAGIPRQ